MTSQEKVFWYHGKNHYAFLGDPEFCEVFVRIQKMDVGWHWEVVERLGNYDEKRQCFRPGILRVGFSNKLETAMRQSVDWADNLYYQFEQSSK